VSRYLEPSEDESFAELLKAELTTIIRWFDSESPRSQQREIGPSELGVLCDRRIGYRIAEIEECNYAFDPLPAIMGTAFHAWAERAVNSYDQSHTTWLPESVVRPSPEILGHSDLYWIPQQTVIDWKTAGPDVLRKIQSEGPPDNYRIQAHLYGYGFEEMGMPVKRVALAFVGRAGLLKNMYVWSEPYSQETARVAMSRVYGIAQKVLDLDALNKSHRWEQVDATPSNDCGFCPWFNPGKDPEPWTLRGGDMDKNTPEWYAALALAAKNRAHAQVMIARWQKTLAEAEQAINDLSNGTEQAPAEPVGQE
jgi:hypothetical protein